MTVLAKVLREGFLIGLAIMLVGCAYTMPTDSPLPERVLGEKTLRTQVIERGAADTEFVHEILHQVGQAPAGNQRLAQILAEHLHHHEATARAVFEELAQHRDFQTWVLEQLRRREEYKTP